MSNGDDDEGCGGNNDGDGDNGVFLFSRCSG